MRCINHTVPVSATSHFSAHHRSAIYVYPEIFRLQSCLMSFVAGLIKLRQLHSSIGLIEAGFGVYYPCSTSVCLLTAHYQRLIASRKPPSYEWRTQRSPLYSKRMAAGCRAHPDARWRLALLQHLQDVAVRRRLGWRCWNLCCRTGFDLRRVPCKMRGQALHHAPKATAQHVQRSFGCESGLSTA